MRPTLLGLLATITGLVTADIAHAAARPNIVIFLADDLSWIDCSIYAKSGIATPNMERIAKEGMTFDHAFVVSPSCAPSRAALLTGLYPVRNGAMFNHQRPDPVHQRWPAYFKELGYEVAAIGKVAHYAQVTEYGFDHASHFKYHEDNCVEVAVDWLKQRKSEKPLCLLVGTNWPHVPWPQKSRYGPDAISLPPTQVDTPETREFRARYAEAVSLADRDLGLVYDAARAKLGGDALFLFTADHGSQFPFGKWNCYDAGLRTPMVAVWPGKIKPGARSSAMVSWIDILPTCLAAAGAEPPASGDGAGQLSGRSFLGVLRGETTEHRDRTFASHSGDGKMNEYPMRSVRTRDWKYIRNLKSDAEFHSHVDKAKDGDGYKYWASWEAKATKDLAAAAVVGRYHKRPAEELYDLRADPHEMRNLAKDPAHAAKLEECRKELDEWMKAEGDKGLASEAEHAVKAAPAKPAVAKPPAKR
jgi:N-sulfoglucosamine sulfohydrolase